MRDYSAHDAIFALSSAKGRSAISLHRISGSRVLEVLLPYLIPAKIRSGSADRKNFRAADFEHAKSKYVTVSGSDGNIIDDCVVTFFKGPSSFTGEDTLEISTHGNPLITARLHSLLRAIGLREAKPGEFTQRAFLNGKLDLTRAEAIDQLIHTETEAGLDLARSASEGRISQVADRIKEQLTGIMSYFEAHIDFADDEVGSYDSKSKVDELLHIDSELRQLANSFSAGLKLREGLRVSFLGTPNAGKSSLYNALLGYERAIVTNVPGTTRDVVEDRLKIRNCDFILLDTAGLRSTDDQVEKIGVARTIQSSSAADIVCIVLDPSQLDAGSFADSIQKESAKLLSHLNRPKNQCVLNVLTKQDTWTPELRASVDLHVTKLRNSGYEIACTSSSSNNTAELAELLEKYHKRLTADTVTPESAVLISQRQYDKVQLARQSLGAAIDLVQKNDFPEKVASMLIQTAQHTCDIVGEIGTEDVLEKIFSSFCIGK
ncbi:MAG: tRNA uridine-5-carboxymethylaminomethyl(34) synthesis GTPase MnmE [Proteobacteria bacterium]|nr:tRNA uridine-5-carboxymethylaminomethyl(34) synthesis GTPase MnmE [Pseudomonadota bacterium]